MNRLEMRERIVLIVVASIIGTLVGFIVGSYDHFSEQEATHVQSK